MLATLRLRGRPGRDGFKVHCGTVLGTNFPHGGKFVPQNSPTMHFDNHLDPVSRATFKWLISLREFCEPGKDGGGNEGVLWTKLQEVMRGVNAE